MRVQLDTRLDALDAEQFDRMLASRSWSIYAARLQAEVARQVERCIGEMDVKELRRAQGAAVWGRDMLALPRRIAAEMRKPTQGPRKAE